MADWKGPRSLTRDEAQQVADHINERALGGPSDPCQVCGKGESVVHHSLVGVDAGISFSAERIAFPAVITICMNCGFIRQFSATVVGLEKKKAEADGTDS